jgi:serine/threonine protein kinase
LAHALAYIHEDSSDRRFVIHKDIKPENIMIGEDFNPKLGDFGLAKFFNHGQSATMESPFGTFGYADPFSDGIPSFRSDMFSFGVVLLVIGSGQPAILGEDVDVIIPHIKYLVMRDYESGRITDVADPRLQGNFVTEEMDAIIRVGLLCVSKKLHERPLANLVTTWLESRTGKNIPDHTDGGPPLYFNSEASSGQSSGIATISWIFVNLSWFFAFHDSSILIFYSMFKLFGCDL